MRSTPEASRGHVIEGATVDIEEFQARTRPKVPLVAAAIAGLGALVAAQFGIPAQIGVASAGLTAGFAVDLLVFTPIVALALALPAWHLFPRRAWPVLVVAGSVCMLPTLVAALSSALALDTVSYLYLITGSAARPLLVVGVLGAATAVYRDGHRRAGAVLTGATLVVPPLATFVVIPFLLESAFGVAVTGLVLVVVGAVLAVVAALATPPPAEPDPRPEWRVTAAGVAAGLVPVIYRLWPGPKPYNRGSDLDTYAQEAADYSLIVGVIVLAIGVTVAIAAGVRVFVTGVAAGLLLGAVATLTRPAALDLYDLPDFLPMVFGAVALALAVVFALPRYRVMVGVSCLGLLIVGLLVLYLVFTADDPIWDVDVTNVVTPVLLAVTVIGVLSVFTSLGMVLLPSSAAPATYAGVVGAVAAGVTGIGASYALDPPSDTPPTFAIYPPVMAFLVVAGALTLFAWNKWQADTRD
jgi:hypothetical protein